jgi:hypothetical protein
MRPATLSAAVLALQATAGNRAVARMVRPRGMQTLSRCSGACTCGGSCGREEDEEQTIALQRQAGNRAATRVLARWTKHPDDKQKGVMLDDGAAAELLRLNPPQNK